MQNNTKEYTIQIYKIVNTINDEIYIGSTKNYLRTRLQQHKQRSAKCSSMNGLYTMASEHGWECFRIIQITERCVSSHIEQLKVEQAFIDSLKPSLNKRIAYGNCLNASYTCEVCKFHTHKKDHYTRHIQSQVHKLREENQQLKCQIERKSNIQPLTPSSITANTTNDTITASLSDQ